MRKRVERYFRVFFEELEEFYDHVAGDAVEPLDI